MNALLTGGILPTGIEGKSTTGPHQFWIVWGLQTCRVYKDRNIVQTKSVGVTAPNAITGFTTVAEAMASVAGCGRMVTMLSDAPVDTMPRYGEETYWR